MKKFLSVSLITLVLFNVSACGTILYPERKGQKHGRLDPSIVVLDGIGLLFFLVPGVIAYAVDFNNGTIYLPNSQRSSLDIDDMHAINVDSDHLDKEAAAKIVSQKTGKQFDVSNAQVYKEDDNGVKIRFY